MKSTIFFILMALSTSAHAAHWECKGTHNLENVSFDLSSGVDNIKVVAPSLEQKDLNKSFAQVNAFTIVALDVIDVIAQETIDYTLIVNKANNTLTVLSQWSTNESVDSETIECSVK